MSRKPNRIVVTLISVGALMALAGCPGSVQKVETYLGDEKSIVNAPAAEGGKEVAKNLAKEALGPAGTVVDVGEATLGAVNTGAMIKIQKDADEAFLAATANPGNAALERRATFLEAKADCFIRKDCKKWYELTGDPNRGSGGGSH
ncbi:hypothetical protein [Pseudotabrizicola alkalilacus]|nr:hypothetical protein [Pseudotabrizicola alkalilacus]